MNKRAHKSRGLSEHDAVARGARLPVLRWIDDVPEGAFVDRD
jgi:hypothetical protein